MGFDDIGPKSIFGRHTTRYNETVTEAEYAVLIEAWEIERNLPYGDRHRKLVELGSREGAEEVVNAVLVDHLVDGGKYEEAQAIAERLLRDRPSAWSHATAASASLYVEGAETALDIAKRALDLDPGNAFALCMAYTSAALSGNHRLAAEYTSKLLAVDSTRSSFIALNICALLSASSVAQARELLASAPSGFAESAGYQVANAFLSASNGKYLAAAEHAAQAAALEPNVESNRLLLAELLNRTDRPTEAEKLAERTLAVNPRSERAHKVMLEGRASAGIGTSITIERPLWTRARRTGPPSNTVGRPRCMVQRGNLDAAARAYQMTVDSKSPVARRVARLGLIGVRLRQRKWTLLMPMLDEFESKPPAPTIVVLSRAGYAAHARNWDEAIRALESVSEADCDESVTHWHLYYLYQARQFSRLVEVAKAKLARSDCSEQAAFQALMALYRAGEVAVGDEQLALCRERFPTGQAILWMQAHRLRVAGDKATAAEIWRQLSPAMRKWKPEERHEDPALVWLKTVGRQFRRTLFRW